MGDPAVYIPGRKTPTGKATGWSLLIILPFMLNDFLIIGFSRSSPLWMQWLLDFSSYFVCMSLLLAFATSKGWIDLKILGLNKFSLAADFLAAIWPAGLLLLICRFGIRILLAKLVLPKTWSYGWAIPEAEPWHFLVVLYAALSAGFFEEIIFRGFITPHLRRVIGSKHLGAFLSVLLFAFIHWSQGLTGVVNALVFGICIQGYYDAFGNMRRTILVHVMYDLWAFW